MKICRFHKSHRAFTIVELVIVIAVIAILAAVLIPTFSNVIQKAKESKDLQENKNAELARSVYEIDVKAGQSISLETAGLYYNRDNGANEIIESAVTTLSEESVSIEGYSFVYKFTKKSTIDDEDLFFEIYIKYYDESKGEESLVKNQIFRTSSSDFLNIENAKSLGCTVSAYSKPLSGNTTGGEYASIKTELSGDNYTLTVKSLSDAHPIISVSVCYKSENLTSAPVLYYTQNE